MVIKLLERERGVWISNTAHLQITTSQALFFGLEIKISQKDLDEKRTVRLSITEIFIAAAAAAAVSTCKIIKFK